MQTYRRFVFIILKETILARNKYPEETIGRILDVATKLFFEKGYEHTTIQDIINDLGDLSKGAIYHHFKSKDEIISAVIDRLYGDTNAMYYQIKASTNLTGLEKLKKLFSYSVGNSNQARVVELVPNMLKNPKFLAMQLDSTMNEIAPKLIEPIILEGIADGSIQTEYPKELAEVIIVLANIWLNPLIFHCSPEALYRKSLFLKQILMSLHVDIIDDELIAQIAQLRKAVKSEN